MCLLKQQLFNISLHNPNEGKVKTGLLLRGAKCDGGWVAERWFTFIGFSFFCLECLFLVFYLSCVILINYEKTCWF
jgi:hypothetical protein